MTEPNLNSPTEAEMNAFLATFNNMRDAIIAGSKLAANFEALKVEVEGLRRDLERVRNQNLALDDALSVSRQARENLVSELSAARQDNGRLQDGLASARRDGEAFQADTIRLEEMLALARNERDTAQLRVMELEEELAAERKKLASVTEAMDTLAKVLHPIQAVEPKPMTEHEPTIQLYPSDRVERAEAQPRTEGGQFSNGEMKLEPIAAKPDPNDDNDWRF